jgi:hypothetical protein
MPYGGANYKPDRGGKGKGKGKGKGRRKNKYLGKGLLGRTPGALKPRSRKQIRRQATRTMRAIYRPGFADLRGQERRINAVSQKRAEDNRRYLQWLDTQGKQLMAHAQAADTELKSTQNQIQAQAAQSFIDLRDQLVDQGGHASGVTNPADATAHDVTPEAQRAIGQVANERERSAQTMKTGKEMANIAQSSNFALMAASDAKRQADQYNALKDVASARQKLILERAAKTAEEVARMLDQEIAKGQARIDMRATAGQLALGLKEHRLGKKQFRLDKKVQLAQLDLAGKELRETKRHNKATERQDRRDSKHASQQDRREAKRDRRQDKKHIKAATKRYLRAHPYPKGKKNRKKALYYLQDRASKLEGVESEKLANRIVKQVVRKWLRSHRGG